jgi:hypothetical protein
MIVAGQRLPILIATKPVDFRCGHQALALIVQTELKLDPHSGVTVVFRSFQCGRIDSGHFRLPVNSCRRLRLVGPGMMPGAQNGICRCDVFSTGLPEEDAAMRSKMGTVVPKMGTTVHLAADQARYREAVAAALRAELGPTHQAIKTAMRWTGASERTVK